MGNLIPDCIAYHIMIMNDKRQHSFVFFLKKKVKYVVGSHSLLNGSVKSGKINVALQIV